MIIARPFATIEQEFSGLTIAEYDRLESMAESLGCEVKRSLAKDYIMVIFEGSLDDYNAFMADLKFSASAAK